MVSLVLRAMVCIVALWAALVVWSVYDTRATMDGIAAKAAAGTPVTQAEMLYDGTGDNAAVLLLGWIPAGLCALGLVLVRKVLLEPKGVVPGPGFEGRT